MKKILIVVMLICCFSFLLLGCEQEASSSESVPMTGAYSERRELTEEDEALFAEVMGEDAESYEMIDVATQVVAGTNYRFCAKDLSTDTRMNIIVYVPLGEDATPELVEITESGDM